MGTVVSVVVSNGDVGSGDADSMGTVVSVVVGSGDVGSGDVIGVGSGIGDDIVGSVVGSDLGANFMLFLPGFAEHTNGVPSSIWPLSKRMSQKYFGRPLVPFLSI